MRRLPLLFPTLAAVAALAIAACGDDGTPTADTDATAAADTVTPNDTGGDDASGGDTTEGDGAGDTSGGDTAVGPVTEGPCDPIDPSRCLFPFPSNLYLTPDAARATGVTLDFGDALPMNADGKPIESAPYRRMDGYGVGTPVLVGFPDVDLSGLATEFHTDPSLDDDVAILWFEEQPSGDLVRFPYFVDRDLEDADPATRVLIVRPAALMKEATRYIVAFRGMKDTAGATYAPSPAFAALLAGTTAGDPALAPRQARFDAVFADLTGAGVDTGELQLAWDFTTASCDALHGPMRHMVTDALATTGDDGPELHVDAVEELDDGSDWALEIRGTFEVPNYMREAPMTYRDGVVYVFNNGPDGLPAQNGTAPAPFWLRIPRSALPAGGEAGLSHGIAMYGHGQNGSGTQVRGGWLGRIANNHHFVFYSTDMWGMSEGDVLGILDTLLDMSGFPRLADRMHQGILNHVLLARAMTRRLPTLPELTARGIVLDPARSYYTGISQGGIYGATVVAASPDLQRGHLGVPGNNYGFLLTRSRNFGPFFLGLSVCYPERWQQVTLLAVIMQIWEQTDPVSYLRHLHADPFPGQGPNEVLLAPAKGDVQVAVSSNEWIARSHIGIPIMAPYDTVRASPSGTETATYPRTGSGIVLYDFGNPWPAESVNRPPTSDAPDPHELPRRDDLHNAQLARFLDTGEIIDVCSEDGSAGCTPN